MIHYCEELNCFEYKLNDIPVCHDHLVQRVLERSSLQLYMFPKDVIRCILDCFDPDEVYYFVNKWNWISPNHCARFAAKNGLLDLFKILPITPRMGFGLYQWDILEILNLVVKNKDLDMLRYLNDKTEHFKVKCALIMYGEEWNKTQNFSQQNKPLDDKKK